MKINEVINKVKRNYKGYGSIDDKTTRDQVLYGDTEKECKGIVTAIWASGNVIEKAHELGANLIISHEALFWNHGDHTDWLQESSNKVYLDKKQLLDEYGITVWRAHDYVHSGIRVEDGSYRDGIFYGFAKKMGWENFMVDDKVMTAKFEIPQTTGKQVAKLLLANLGLNGARVIGSLNNNVSKIAIPFHVFGDANDEITEINKGNVDLLLPMEINDFTLSQYVRDNSILNGKVAIISVGHFNIEEPGMSYMAKYLPALLNNEVGIHFVKVGDTYDYVLND
ncbi:hypothetical protein PESHB5_19310 [Pediococcus parvulus]